MPTSAEIRANWLNRLFSTDPPDPSSVATAAAKLYTACNLPEPRHLLWFDSPYAGAWIVALLLARRSSLWRSLAGSVHSSQREPLEQLKQAAAKQAGFDNFDALAESMGAPLPDKWSGMMMASPIDSAILTSRVKLYDSVSAMVAMPDASDDLFRAESAFWYSTNAALAGQEFSSVINPLVSGSAYADYPVFKMAADEAAGQSRDVPAVLSAAWTIARSSGPWWKFANGLVLTANPERILRNERYLLHSGDGPAVIYRDGSKVYAWEGRAQGAKWIEDPASLSQSMWKQLHPELRKHLEAKRGASAAAPAKRGKSSSVLQAALPAHPAERLAFLRERAKGKLPLYDRYAAGEHEAVWKELIALGAAVRTEEHAPDALAVAYETMQRVESNVRIVTARLQEMQYRFRTARDNADQWIQNTESAMAAADAVSQAVNPAHVPPALMGLMDRLRAMVPKQVEAAKANRPPAVIRAHVPPGKNAAKKIRDLEKLAGPIPLSLRAFYEVVGSVDWMGSHPSLAPAGAQIAPDPLVVDGIDDAIEQAESLGEECDAIAIAPDDLHKSQVSGGDPYEVEVPSPAADAKLRNERHDFYFVEYLRLCFRYGGFPGYEGRELQPPELESLREGLTAF